MFALRMRPMWTSLNWSERRDDAIGVIGNIVSLRRTLVISQTLIIFYYETMQGCDILCHNLRFSDNTLTRCCINFFVDDIARTPLTCSFLCRVAVQHSLFSNVYVCEVAKKS